LRNFDSFNPSSRKFKGVITEAQRIFKWRHDLPSFYREITNHKPYPYQKEFLEEMEDLLNQYAIISAGRGTGKTECLAVLALWYVYVLPLTDPGQPMKVVILAGSDRQARICYGYIMSFISRIPFLQKALAKQPTREEILFQDGSSIKPLTASEKSVRGPHPDLLIIDEACQADDELLVAAMPMIGTSKYPRLVLSSTPDKFFSLFVEVYTKSNDYPQFKRFNWSAEDCPAVSKSFLQTQKRLIDSGNYTIEYLGLPYSFAGKVFPLEQLRKCVRHKNLRAGEGRKFAGIDWGHFPSPTVVVIVEEEVLDDKRVSWKVLHTQPFLKENFEEVLDKVELILRSYQVSKVFTDSNDIGENQRLMSRGLPVFPVKFKSQKAAMISNLRALVENLLLKIDNEKHYSLVAQLRDYRYDSKKNDDFVDALMLACRGSRQVLPLKWDLKDFIVVSKRSRARTKPFDIIHQMDPRYVKPEEIDYQRTRKLLKKLRPEKDL